MLDAIWECLLPGIGCRASTRDDEILAGRLRGLSLPLVPGSAGPERSVTATLDASAEGSALPDGTTVTVVPAGGAWRLRFGSLPDIEAGRRRVDPGSVPPRRRPPAC